MKCLIRTSKEFIKEDIKSIFAYNKFFSGNDSFIARIKVPLESDIVKKNIEYLNKVINDDSLYGNEMDCNKIYEYPILNYLEYYNTIINYRLIIKDGKPIKEVIINDELIDVVTDYSVTVGPLEFETDDKTIVLTALNLGEELDLWDYESIHSLIPNIVDTLVNEGYAEISEV